MSELLFQCPGYIVQRIDRYSLFVFAEYYLEGSLGLPSVSLATIFARDLVNHTSLFLLWNAVLQIHQGLHPHGLECCPDPCCIKAKSFSIHFSFVTDKDLCGRNVIHVNYCLAMCSLKN